VGVPRVPLSRLYGPAAGVIERAGGRVRLGEGVEAVGPDRVRLRGGEEERFGRVVLAVPFERAAGLLEAGNAADGRVGAMNGLRHSPIVGVHLVFDRGVLETGHGVLLGDGAPWVFRKDASGRRVHAVISAADDWVGLSEAAIVERVVGVMRACLAGMDGSERVVHARVVKEKRATFVPNTEAEACRVEAGGESGVVLAGCYTATGWPSTMEGAVRSGLRAAEVVLGRAAGSLVRPALRAGAVGRAVGGRSLRLQGRAAGTG
jgi:zeta-carotene desaturase